MRRFIPVVALLLCSALVLVWIRLDATSPVANPTAGKVYPKAASQLRFSHEKHAEMPCVGCHTNAGNSALSADALTPKMETCVGCHTQQEPLISQCSGCHSGMPESLVVSVSTPEEWRAVRPAPLVLPRPQAALRFAHNNHTQVSCESCHQGTKTPPQMPTMDSCMTCHSQGTAGATPCANCHTAAVQGMQATRLTATGAPALKPQNHTLDWMKRHGRIAMSQGADCVSCHQETDCATCHTAQVAKPFSVHPPGYTLSHTVDARADVSNCVSCHTVDGFCAECHTRSLVTMRPPGAPPRLAFHPPGWVDSRTSGHGVMARQNINECASCHVENDCVSCHTGINPHPPEYRMQCKSWLDANPTPCARCHTDMSALRSMCL